MIPGYFLNTWINRHPISGITNTKWFWAKDLIGHQSLSTNGTSCFTKAAPTLALHVLGCGLSAKKKTVSGPDWNKERSEEGLHQYIGFIVMIHQHEGKMDSKQIRNSFCTSYTSFGRAYNRFSSIFLIWHFGKKTSWEIIASATWISTKPKHVTIILILLLTLHNAGFISITFQRGVAFIMDFIHHLAITWVRQRVNVPAKIAFTFP